MAFVGSVAHAVDVGGLSWASHAMSVFEEGIRVPIARLYRAGAANEQLFELIRANVRLPEIVTGDIQAQIAACELAAARLLELLADSGLDGLDELALAIQGHAETTMRGAIRELPDGVYETAFPIDGFDRELRIQARLTIAGDSLTMDYAGTSDEIDRGINSVYNYTYAYTAYPLKCALDPGTPKNEGSYRPIAILAPEGSILNPRFPAPVSARHLTGMYCAAAAFQALAQAAPDKVMADSSGPPARPVVSGRDANGNPFILIMFPWGGMGARADLDGLPCTAFPGNDNCATVEMMEAIAPVRFQAKAVIPDSGGAGRFQGGAGQELSFTYLSPHKGSIAMMSARFRTPAAGLLGGLPGTLTEYRINGQKVPDNGRHDLHEGDVVTIRYPGGGGYGDPRERDPALVARDIADGIVTAARADEVYGRLWRSAGVEP
jgi:N-methylhydantoinase B